MLAGMSDPGRAAPANATPRPSPASRAARAALGLALLAALAARLLYLGLVAPMPLQSDASGYDAAARRLIANRSYAFPVGPDLWANDVFREDAWGAFTRLPANAWSMPGYTWFLTGIYRIAGTGPERIVVVRVVQALIGTLTLALLFRLADTLLGRRTAWVALVLAAVYPPGIQSTQHLLTETLFTLLIAGQVALMVWAARSRSVLACGLLGLVSAAAIYVRPIAICVPGLLLALEAWRWFRAPTGREPAGRLISRFALLGLVIVLLMTPWWMRNGRLYGAFVPFGSATDLPAVQGELFARGQPFRHETLAQHAQISRTGYDDHRYARETAAEIRKLLPPLSPRAWAESQLARAGMLGSALTSPYNFYSTPVAASSPGFVMQVVLIALALVGLWRARRGAMAVVFLGGLAVCFIAVQWTVSMPWSRYFYPMMPFLITLAAAGLVGARAPAEAREPHGPRRRSPATAGGRERPASVVTRPAPSATPPWLRRAPLALVILAGGGLLLLLSAGIPPPAAYTNDFVLHLSLARGLAENHTLDFWHSTDLGYPALRLYQPFYHLTLAVLNAATGGALGLPWIAQILLVALGLALPAGVYLGVRRWLIHEDLEPTEASWAAAIAALLGVVSCSFSGFGYDALQSVYSRYGVVTQTWSMVFFAPAFAWTAGYLTGRVRSPWPGLALSLLVWGFSMIVGVMLAMCVALRAGVEAVVRRDARAVARGAGYFLLLAVVTAFLWWPLVADSPWVNYPRPFFAAWVNEGFGRSAAFKALFGGTLLDGASLEVRGRAPVMTALLAIGVVALFGHWRRRPALVVYLIVGIALWFSFFAGKDVWGGLLYALPLLRSYQWGRMEAMVQFWATIIVAIGVVRAWPVVWDRSPAAGRWAVVAAAVAALALLARLPIATASYDRSVLAAARAGDAGRIVRDLAPRLRGETTRTYVGGPTTWEGRMTTGHVLTGVALVGEGIAGAGRMYQGMNYASAMVYLWDGVSPWGASLLSIGHWLAPCGMVPRLPVVTPADEVGAGMCLARARTSSPLAFFSTLAATPPRTLTEDQIVARQRALLAAPETDGFLPFRPGRAPARELPGSFAPLRSMVASGNRFARVAPGVAASRLRIEAPADGAVVFPVPFHPRLRGSVDGADVSPVPVVPGYAALAVRAGVHDVALTYRTDHVRDALFLLSVVLLGAGAVASRRRRPAPEPVT